MKKLFFISMMVFLFTLPIMAQTQEKTVQSNEVERITDKYIDRATIVVDSTITKVGSVIEKGFNVSVESFRTKSKISLWTFISAYGIFILIGLIAGTIAYKKYVAYKEVSSNVAGWEFILILCIFALIILTIIGVICLPDWVVNIKYPEAEVIRTLLGVV